MRTSFRFLLFLLLMGWALQSGWVLASEIAGIQLYRAVVSPVLSKSPLVQCRFQPTCSVYAIDQLKSRGLVRGNVALAQRLLACSPVGFVLAKYGFQIT